MQRLDLAWILNKNADGRNLGKINTDWLLDDFKEFSLILLGVILTQ